jgi:hypothetical protein
LLTTCGWSHDLRVQKPKLKLKKVNVKIDTDVSNTAAEMITQCPEGWKYPHEQVVHVFYSTYKLTT